LQLRLGAQNFRLPETNEPDAAGRNSISLASAAARAIRFVRVLTFVPVGFGRFAKGME
jgi:hypothetical protein